MASLPSSAALPTSSIAAFFRRAMRFKSFAASSNQRSPNRGAARASARTRNVAPASIAKRETCPVGSAIDGDSSLFSIYCMAADELHTAILPAMRSPKI